MKRAVPSTRHLAFDFTVALRWDAVWEAEVRGTESPGWASPLLFFPSTLTVNPNVARAPERSLPPLRDTRHTLRAALLKATVAAALIFCLEFIVSTKVRRKSTP